MAGAAPVLHRLPFEPRFVGTRRYHDQPVIAKRYRPVFAWLPTCLGWSFSATMGRNAIEVLSQIDDATPDASMCVR